MNATRAMTEAQRRKIWAAAHELGWDYGRLHEELEQVIGVSSLRDLTFDHAALFIEFQVSEGATPGRRASHGRRRDPPANLITLASAAQREYISRLLAALKLGETDPYFLAILKRAIGRTSIRTMDEADVTIGVLKKLLVRYGDAPPWHQGSTGGDGSRGV